MLDPLFSGVASALDALYAVIPSYGGAIAALTLVVYLITWPLTAKSTRSMTALADLQPELDEIRRRYPDDRQQRSEETYALMKAHGASPAGACLPALVQMPIFLVLYQVILGLTRRDAAGALDPKYLAAESSLRRALEATRSEEHTSELQSP